MAAMASQQSMRRYIESNNFFEKKGEDTLRENMSVFIPILCSQAENTLRMWDYKKSPS